MGQVLDFTEHKLKAIANSLDNPEDVEIILGILGDYYEGEIAIAWEEGQAVIMPAEGGGTMRGLPPGFSMVGYEPALIVDEEEGEEG